MATLDALPPEILFNILSFASPFDPTLAPRHPLYTVAATNRHLRSVAEEYTRGLLKKHADITPPKASRIFTCRKTWIKWLDKTCQLCKKRSVRKAILDATMTCCSACDNKTFPKMVSLMYLSGGVLLNCACRLCPRPLRTTDFPNSTSSRRTLYIQISLLSPLASTSVPATTQL